MPPRYSYWTILAGGLPTAFRSAERADLLPTFNRIREKHPDAEMKWFARGRLWASPEDAQADLQRARDRRERRDRDWRPGGEHRDPRQKVKNTTRRDAAREEHKPRQPSARPGPQRDLRGPQGDRPGPPRDRPGPPRERTGPQRDRPGPPRERTGPPRDRPGPPRDRPGPQRDRSSRPPRKRER